MSDEEDNGGMPPIERTIMVPRPGNRPASPDVAATQVEPPPAQASQTVVTPAVDPQAMTADSTLVAARSPGLSTPAPQPMPLPEQHFGGNRLVAAAGNLLNVLRQLGNTLEHGDVPGLHRQLVDEVQRMESRARSEGIDNEQLLFARYALCTALDEAVMNTPWGAHSNWNQNPLLSVFHNETLGGEKFFNMLAQLLQAPARNVDLLELMYLCISLGFEGKYRVDPHGREELERMRDNLYRTIESTRPPLDRDLSAHWQGRGPDQSKMINYVPLWVLGCVVVAVLLLSYSGYRFWLYQITEPTEAEILELASEQERLLF
jgi:type VI secretion system protein ImpK